MEKWLPLSIQHKEHREWLQKLDFFSDEIRIFLNELQLVYHAHPNDFNRLEHIEEYKSLLLKKQKNIAGYRQLIARHESELGEGHGAEDFVTHNALRQKINSFEQKFNEFKQNFRRFVAHND